MARRAVIVCVVSAALMMTSFALAARSPSSPHAQSSVTSLAAGQCSKPEAAAVVRRLGWSNLSSVVPVLKVLCGSFTRAVDVVAGDVFQADFGPLGAIGVSFA